MSRVRNILFSLIPALLLMVLFAGGCGGAAQEIATIRKPQGGVEARGTPETSFLPAVDGTRMSTGGAARTGPKGSGIITFSKGSNITLRPNTFFEVGGEQDLGAQKEGTAIYRIQKGGGQISVDSPVGHTLVLGTTFAISLATDVSTLWVQEGTVAFTPNMGGASQTLTAGQKLLISRTGSPSAPIAFDPAEEDRVFKGDGTDPKLNQE